MPPLVDELEVKSALTPTSGFLRGITHSLNPYGGCALACAYCYVQELPVTRYSPYAAQAWGDWVRPKVNLPELLRGELERAARRGKLDALKIFMSSATDPYQPLERRYQLTRRCLEVMAEHQPGWLIVQTRGPLVTRDIDLLRQLGRRAMVSVTLETNLEAVRRVVTPRAPGLAQRRAAMAQLRAAGLYVQAALAPLLPCEAASFAEQLDPLCDRALVDTYVAGDGAGGRRTARLGIPALYREHGWGAWDDEQGLRGLVAALEVRLGPERVVAGQVGFVTPPPGYGA